MTKSEPNRVASTLRRWARLESHATLGFLGLLFLQPLLFPQWEHHLDWWYAVALVLCYIPLHYFRGRTSFERLIVIVAITCMGTASLVFELNNICAVFFVYAADAAASQPNRRHRWTAATVILVGVLTSVIAANAQHRPSILVGLLMAIVPIGVVVIARIRNMAHEKKTNQLANRQSQLTQEVTSAERERISRDLHDSLGQTLALITLKCELATRLIDKDAESAKREIYEVIDASRNATAELRDVVQGTRRWTIRDEINVGSQILNAAGIEFESAFDELKEIDPKVEDAFALVIREGITNVIKHSTATQVSIQVTTNQEPNRIELTLSDNGNGEQVSSGLVGLHERIQQLGGELEVRPEKSGLTLFAVWPSHQHEQDKISNQQG